jgi:hypothetical protein
MDNLKNKLVKELMRDKKKMILLAVLLVVGVAVVGRLVLAGSPPAKAKAAVASPPRSAAPDPLPAEPEPPDRRPDKRHEPLDTTISQDLFVASESIYGRAPASSDGHRRYSSGSSTGGASPRSEVEQQSSMLKLQSTVVSDAPTAIINDQVLRVGDVIEGFRVVGISSRMCEVEKDSIRITLEMR